MQPRASARGAKKTCRHQKPFTRIARARHAYKPQHTISASTAPDDPAHRSAAFRKDQQECPSALIRPVRTSVRWFGLKAHGRHETGTTPGLDERRTCAYVQTEVCAGQEFVRATRRSSPRPRRSRTLLRYKSRWGAPAWLSRTVPGRGLKSCPLRRPKIFFAQKATIKAIPRLARLRSCFLSHLSPRLPDNRPSNQHVRLVSSRFALLPRQPRAPAPHALERLLLSGPSGFCWADWNQARSKHCAHLRPVPSWRVCCTLLVCAFSCAGMRRARARPCLLVEAGARDGEPNRRVEFMLAGVFARHAARHASLHS